MITEDYVSFEVAKLLKEKGFDVPCDSYYFTGNNQLQIAFDFEHDWNNTWEHAYTRPTHKTAMKWIREVHKIDIDITGRLSLTPEYHICEYRYRLHYSNAPSHDINQKFKTYEEAVEEAIKYCLENLI